MKAVSQRTELFCSSFIGSFRDALFCRLCFTQRHRHPIPNIVLTSVLKKSSTIMTSAAVARFVPIIPSLLSTSTAFTMLLPSLQCNQINSQEQRIKSSSTKRWSSSYYDLGIGKHEPLLTDYTLNDHSVTK